MRRKELCSSFRGCYTICFPPSNLPNVALTLIHVWRWTLSLEAITCSSSSVKLGSERQDTGHTPNQHHDYRFAWRRTEPARSVLDFSRYTTCEGPIVSSGRQQKPVQGTRTYHGQVASEAGLHRVSGELHSSKSDIGLCHFAGTSDRLCPEYSSSGVCVSASHPGTLACKQGRDDVRTDTGDQMSLPVRLISCCQSVRWNRRCRLLPKHRRLVPFPPRTLVGGQGKRKPDQEATAWQYLKAGRQPGSGV
ncbi:hypothetical protein F4780DRAFT_212843 [Xylariomycetidae sp. FL0641]|nr:hypothetical protein F4780DRAFT_212843 [Xylariomycetidae sp. FL0641]